MSVSVLTVGSSPNVFFYAWKLHETRSAEVTLASTHARNEVIFKSASQEHRFRAHGAYTSLSKVPPRSFDVVILSCSSLQSVQSTVSEVAPFLANDTLVVIESTHYVNLEPFVHASLPKGSHCTVVSIMNELDVRPVGPCAYAFVNRCPHEPRVYVGTSSGDAKAIQSNRNYQRFSKLWGGNSRLPGSVNVVKTLNPKEFMTYQWKLALPVIVFHTLSVVFETDTPTKLSQQILSKPLVTGLVNELFRIIKKMECKLVKGCESEANLAQNELNMFKNHTPSGQFPEYFYANKLFYSFYHRHDIETDLLLLQPILLGDDHGIRTPYLENLYSILCQLQRVNKEGNSLFFSRTGDLRDSSHEAQISALEEKVRALSIENTRQKESHNDLSASDAKLKKDLSASDAKLQGLLLQISEAERRFSSSSSRLDTQNSQLKAVEDRLAAAQAKLRSTEKLAAEAEARAQQAHEDAKNALSRQASAEQKLKKITSELETPRSNLREFADIVAYADESPAGDTYYTMNPASEPNTPVPIMQSQFDSQSQSGQPVRQVQPQQPYQPNQPQQMQPPSSQTFQYNQPPPNQPQNGYAYQNGNGNVNGNVNGNWYGNANGYGYNGYGHPKALHKNSSYSGNMDQLPPHGLPSTGMPNGQFPPHLRQDQRRSDSMVSSVNRYSQAPGPRRVASGTSFYDMGTTNAPSFSNAAPIDPLIESRFRSNPKRPNRRSAFPSMSMNLDGMDMGGRGGMPQPGQPQKHRMGPGSQTSPPMKQRASSLGGNAYLSPPMNNFSSGSSTQTDDTPQTAEEQPVHSFSMNVPEPTPVPLGGIAQPSTGKEKKKKGFFGKKK